MKGGGFGKGCCVRVWEACISGWKTIHFLYLRILEYNDHFNSCFHVFAAY